MRRPKILGAAIVAMATATMFSSCIETDEPAGIEKLRTAKAEFIAAESAIKVAEINRVAAETAILEMDAKAKELANARTQLENTMLEAENNIKLEKQRYELELQKQEDTQAAEEAKLAFELAKQENLNAIEEAKQELEQATLAHQEALVVANTTLAQAQQDYEVALKEIEIANATALDPEASYFDDYTNAYDDMKFAKNAYLGYNGTSQNLLEAQEDLAEAQEDLATAISQDANDMLTEYTWKVKNAQLAYDYAKAAYDETSKLEVINSATVASKLIEIAAEKKALDNKELELKAELAELENIFREKNDAYYKEYDKVNEDLNKYQNESKYYTFDVTGDILKEFFSKDYNKPNNFIFNGENKLTSEYNIYNFALNNDLGSTYSSNLLSICKNEIISEEELAQNTQIVAELQSQLPTLKATYDADLAAWETALEAYKKAALDYKWSDENWTSSVYEEVIIAVNNYKNLQETEKTDEVKQALADKINNYLQLRKVFDGYAIEDYKEYSIYNVEEGVYEDFKYATLFDGEDLSSTDLKNFDTALNQKSTTYILGEPAGIYPGGAHKEYTDASLKFFDNVRYTMYTDEEIKISSDYDLKYNMGTFGKYQFAVRNIEEKQNAIDSREDWMALLAQVEAVIDAYDEKVAELTNAKADKYEALNPLREAYEAAQLAVDEKNDEITAVTTEKDALTNIENVYKAYEEKEDILRELEYALEVAKNDLDDAEAQLALVKEGKLEEAKTMAVKIAESAVEFAEERVAEATAANEEAKAEYEAAKATFDAIYAIIATEE